MATEKQLKTRLIQKHDTEANWNKATNFIPKDGELIIYDIDATNTHKRLKIGDGSTSIVNLPFVNQYLEDSVLLKTEQILTDEELGQVYTNLKLADMHTWGTW